MKILFIIGTRPEGIKMAPLIKAFQADDIMEVVVCNTGQHREMLDQVLNFFEIEVDYQLDLMKPNQSLFEITSNILLEIKAVIEKEKPDIVFVQGDTTTAFIGALAAFYNKIKIAHVEAGLRSGDMYSPFPEEANRQLVGRLTNYHFAPTDNAKKSLLKEGVNEKQISVVGNTVIDALLTGLELIKQKNESELLSKYQSIDFDKRLILITGHRRESFGKPFEEICKGISTIAEHYPDVELVYPVHLNPNVREVVFEKLNDFRNIHLIDPLDYDEMIWFLNQSFLVLTDSGGIQEEAPSLGKPVLVMREVTERTEGIEAGTAQLVGTDSKKIIKACTELLTSKKSYEKMARAVNPYGDGKTSERILNIIKESV